MLASTPSSSPCRSPDAAHLAADIAGRLHRLHDQKKEVIIYDYADTRSADAGQDASAAFTPDIGVIGYRVNNSSG